MSQLLRMVLQWTLGRMFLFKRKFCPSICPGVLDHMVVLVLVFKGTSVLFSLVAAPIYTPTSRIGGFPFLHTLQHLLLSSFLLLSFLGSFIHKAISPHPLPLSPLRVSHCATILCPCSSLQGHCLIPAHSFPLNHFFTEILTWLFSAFLFSPLCIDFPTYVQLGDQRKHLLSNFSLKNSSPPKAF